MQAINGRSQVKQEGKYGHSVPPLVLPQASAAEGQLLVEVFNSTHPHVVFSEDQWSRDMSVLCQSLCVVRTSNSEEPLNIGSNTSVLVNVADGHADAAVMPCLSTQEVVVWAHDEGPVLIVLWAHDEGPVLIIVWAHDEGPVLIVVWAQTGCLL